MWIQTEDARSDFILAAATALVGWYVQAFLARLGFYPRVGLVAALLELAWLFALTGLVPLLLVRYRGSDLASFGLQRSAGALPRGLLLTIPVAAVGVIRLWADGGVPLPWALLGTLGLADDALTLALALVQVAVVFAGATMLYGFLTVRAREGFGRREIAQLEALRTYGMGAAGIALLMGLLTVAAGVFRIVSVLVTVAGLALLVLIADRMVTTGHQTTRATVLAPAIVALVLNVFLVGGGLFGGGLLFGLYTGSLAAGLVVVVAVLLETRSNAWAVLPMLLGTALYPSMLTPLPLGAL